MHIKIQRQRLAKALNYVSKAVSSRPNIPVLSNVLLEVKGDQLRLSATNLDMGINMWIPGVGEMDGSITVSGKFLSDFITASGGDKVEMKVVEDTLSVKTEKSKAEFQIIPASEFPILPKMEGEAYLQLPAVEFVDAMNKVIFACATDLNVSTIQFTGVLFELEESSKHMNFVGLNGFRLSLKKIKLEQPAQESLQLIVPAKSLQELVKIIADVESSNLSLYLNESRSQIIFELEDIEFSIRLLEGPFPDYKGVIPNDHAFSYEIEKKEIEQSLRVVNTFARTISGNKVNCDLDIESGKLTLHTEVADLGKNETVLAVEKAEGNSDLKDAYSLQFLMDFVNHVQGDKIRFETSAPLAAAVFQDKSDKSFQHIIMPLLRDDS